MAYPTALQLTVLQVNSNVQPAIGNYLLGHLNQKGALVVKYVGRSDTDLNERLLDHVGEYEHFTFQYASSEKVAFEQECRDYHRFGGEKGSLDNAVHPDRPDGFYWKCPICPP